MKLNSDPRLPSPDSTLGYLQRLNARLYDLWRTLTTAVNERLTVQKNGAHIGAQPVLNLIEGAGATLAVSENLAEGRIDVEITAGSGGCCDVRTDDTTGYSLTVGAENEVVKVWLPQPTEAQSGYCTAIVTGAVTVEIWPATPSCPPAEATAQLKMLTPDGIEYDLGPAYILRGVPYTVPSCSGVDYPMSIGTGLTWAVTLDDYGGDYANTEYQFWIEVTYTHPNTSLAPACTAALTVHKIPCAYQPI